MEFRTQIDELLSQHDVLYWFVSESGAAVLSMQPGFESATATFLEPEASMAPFATASYGLVVSAFLAATSDGWAHAVVQSNDDGSAQRVEAFDLRPELEAFLITMAPTNDEAPQPTKPPAEVPVRMIHSRLDASGMTTAVDSGVTKLLGWSVDDFLAIPSIERMHADDREHSSRWFADLLSRPGGQSRVRCRIRCADGSWLWMEVTHTNRLHTDDPHIQAEALDISAELEVQIALQEREELLGLLTEALPVGVLHLEPDGTPDISNRAWQELTGASLSDALRTFLDCVDDASVVEAALQDAREKGQHVDLKVSCKSIDASRRHADLRIRALPGDAAPYATLLTLTDTTDVVSVQTELRHLARNDHLTRILNRYGIEEHLDAELVELNDESPALTLLYCDLNNFKSVNDAYGHSVGDAVLVATAEQIRLQLRPNDVVGRLGGDEFVAVLCDTSPAEARAIAGRIARQMHALSATFDRPLELSMSIGSTTAVPGDDFSSLVGRADAAMYAAKSARKQST